MEVGTIKYIVTNRFGTVAIILGPDGLWRELASNGPDACVFAMRFDGALDDSDPRCGINPFVIPIWLTPSTVAASCKAHDYMYESPAFQMYHTRTEADENLETLIETDDTWGFLGAPFRWLAEKFGKFGSWGKKNVD